MTTQDSIAAPVAAPATETPAASPEYQRYLAGLKRERLLVRAWQLAIIIGFLILWQIALERGLRQSDADQLPVAGVVDADRTGEERQPVRAYLGDLVLDHHRLRRQR